MLTVHTLFYPGGRRRLLTLKMRKMIYTFYILGHRAGKIIILASDDDDDDDADDAVNNDEDDLPVSCTFKVFAWLGFVEKEVQRTGLPREQLMKPFGRGLLIVGLGYVPLNETVFQDLRHHN